MAIVQIPVKSDVEGPQEYDITVDGIAYHFQFSYNKRAERWKLSIFDINRNAILQNLVLLADVDIFRSFRHMNIPKGVFMVIDSLNQAHNPTEYDWGDRNYFLYNEVI